MLTCVSPCDVLNLRLSARGFLTDDGSMVSTGYSPQLFFIAESSNGGHAALFGAMIFADVFSGLPRRGWCPGLIKNGSDVPAGYHRKEPRQIPQSLRRLFIDLVDQSEGGLGELR
jgi:hypothetical protein